MVCFFSIPPVKLTVIGLLWLKTNTAFAVVEIVVGKSLVQVSNSFLANSVFSSATRSFSSKH